MRGILLFPSNLSNMLLGKNYFPKHEVCNLKNTNFLLGKSLIWKHYVASL